MSWRTVVISSSAKLDYQMGYMVVRSAETTKILVDEIRSVMIESTAVSLSAALLAELVKNKVKVIFCDQKRNPSSELIPYYGSFDTSGKIRTQIAWNKDIKTAVWTEIVTEKIRKQKEHLVSMQKQEASLLGEYLNQIEFGDVTNREGHAAKVYFNALFGHEFTRSEDCNENAALNYGYSIILSAFTREVAANGYLTQLGLFHDNRANPFNLASDLMEPFRPLVDRIVLTMELKQFLHAEKMELVGVLSQQVIMNDRSEYVDNAIQIYCRSVFDALNDHDVSEIRFYRNMQK
ncbi:MAG: type II CRISPR-associated endonuclease Cas1 [Oscillospiraceae bacterium]|jgi:CRISPR-associated endonuclease Cas1 subtype II|nr:type II CRISPR-associated endonuclease Cas1 [Oscillospiraceae bacterium]